MFKFLKTIKELQTRVEELEQLKDITKELTRYKDYPEDIIEDFEMLRNMDKTIKTLVKDVNKHKESIKILDFVLAAVKDKVDKNIEDNDVVLTE